MENHNPGCLPCCMLLKTSFRLIFAKVVSNVGWKRERGHAVAGRARWHWHQLSCCCEPLPGTRVCTHTHTCAPCTHVPECEQLPPGAPPAFHSHFVPPSLPISGFHHQDPKKCFRVNNSRFTTVAGKREKTLETHGAILTGVQSCTIQILLFQQQ